MGGRCVEGNCGGVEGHGDDDEPKDAVEDAGEGVLGGTLAKRTFFAVPSIAEKYGEA